MDSYDSSDDDDFFILDAPKQVKELPKAALPSRKRELSEELPAPSHSAGSKKARSSDPPTAVEVLSSDDDSSSVIEIEEAIIMSSSPAPVRLSSKEKELDDLLAELESDENSKNKSKSRSPEKKAEDAKSRRVQFKGKNVVAEPLLDFQELYSYSYRVNLDDIEQNTRISVRVFIHWNIVQQAIHHATRLSQQTCDSSGGSKNKLHMPTDFDGHEPHVDAARICTIVQGAKYYHHTTGTRAPVDQWPNKTLALYALDADDEMLRNNLIQQQIQDAQKAPMLSSRMYLVSPLSELYNYVSRLLNPGLNQFVICRLRQDYNADSMVRLSPFATPKSIGLDAESTSLELHAYLIDEYEKYERDKDIYDNLMSRLTNGEDITGEVPQRPYLPALGEPAPEPHPDPVSVNVPAHAPPSEVPTTKLYKVQLRSPDSKLLLAVPDTVSFTEMLEEFAKHVKVEKAAIKNGSVEFEGDKLDTSRTLGDVEEIMEIFEDDPDDHVVLDVRYKN